VAKELESVVFYKVPFNLVLSLVSARLVYLKDGNAYIPALPEWMSYPLRGRFKAFLTKEMEAAHRALPYKRYNDERVEDFLNSFRQSVAALVDQGTKWCPVKVDRNVELSHENLDEYARCMPLCMRIMHRALKVERHLKWFQRMSFILFLKGLGLSLESVDKYWKARLAAYSKQGKYNYQVAYLFGKAGTGQIWQRPYDCQGMHNAGVQGLTAIGGHGCPFQLYSAEQLEDTLRSSMSASDIRQVIDLVEKKAYSDACRLHFTSTHKGCTLAKDSAVGIHPNEWFEASLKHDSSSK
jgi:DNA primase large subunit